MTLNVMNSASGEKLKSTAGEAEPFAQFFFKN
jgi:hypothetical protein